MADRIGAPDPPGRCREDQPAFALGGSGRAAPRRSLRGLPMADRRNETSGADLEKDGVKTSKLQPPRSREDPSSNTVSLTMIKSSERGFQEISLDFWICSLELLWILDVGAWIFRRLVG